MEFGKILDQWHKRSGQVYDKDKELLLHATESAASRRRRLIRKSPEATIDLHGMTRDQAWDALWDFFNTAKCQSLEKVLVIHGKGIQTAESGQGSEGVLKKLVRDFIERCPFAGENGYSSASSGGSGSTWVLLKKNQRSR